MISNDTIAEDIYIGTAETDGVCLIAQTARNLQNDFPNIHFHFYNFEQILIKTI